MKDQAPPVVLPEPYPHQTDDRLWREPEPRERSCRGGNVWKTGTRLLNPLKSQVDPYQTFIVVIGKPAALASNSRNAEAGLGFNPLR